MYTYAECLEFEKEQYITYLSSMAQLSFEFYFKTLASNTGMVWYKVFPYTRAFEEPNLPPYKTYKQFMLHLKRLCPCQTLFFPTICDHLNNFSLLYICILYICLHFQQIIKDIF